MPEIKTAAPGNPKRRRTLALNFLNFPFGGIIRAASGHKGTNSLPAGENNNWIASVPGCCVSSHIYGRMSGYYFYPFTLFGGTNRFAVFGEAGLP